MKIKTDSRQCRGMKQLWLWLAQEKFRHFTVKIPGWVWVQQVRCISGFLHLNMREA